MEGHAVKIYLKISQDGLEAHVKAYDDEGRLVGREEFKQLKQLELNTRARISPQVTSSLIVIVVENARITQREGTLVVERRG